MIIDKNKRFIFIHIPRTGGTTLRGLLTPLNDEKCVNIVKETSWAGHTAVLNHYDHANLDWFPKMMPLNYSEIFCFVRNPWDRFRSLYLKMLNDNLREISMYGDFHRAQGEALHLSTAMSSFDNFIDAIYIDNKAARDPHANFRIDNLFEQPQSYWWRHAKFTHIYKFENYEENVKAILEKYDITDTEYSVVPHANKGVVEYKYDYDLTYTPEMLEKVAYIETDTIKKFGYNF